MFNPAGYYPGVGAFGGFAGAGAPGAGMASATATTGYGGAARSNRLQPRDPRIEIVNQKEDSIRFVLSDTDVSIANALRRVMIAEVPTMAIDLVEFIDNSSVLHDEFLAHRLGLLPLRVSTAKGVEQFLESHLCSCSSYCPNCSVVFELDAYNDGRQGETMNVYSSDLITQTEGIEVVGYSSKDEASHGMRDQGKGIVVAKLGVDQRLKLRAIAKRGIGKIHAKWSPVAVATYTFEPRVFLNDARLDEISESQRREFVASCPTKVYGFDERSKKVVLANEPACIFCNECVRVGREFKEKGDDDNVVSIESAPGRFIFNVETVGSLRPEEVVIAALRRLQTLVKEIRSECQNLVQSGREESDNLNGVAHLLFKDTGGFI